MEEEVARKVCTKCGESKLITEYHRKGKGYRSWCKSCKKLEDAIYIESHKEEIKAYRNSPAGQEAIKAYQSIYQVRHKEERKAYLLVYNAANKEILAEKGKAKYRLNKEHISARSRKYYLANSDAIKERSSAWASKNLTKVNQYSRNKRARKLESIGSFTQQDLAQLFAAQGGSCVYCGTDLTNNFEPDHIFPISKYKYDSAINIQLLCPTCNNRKLAKEPEQYEALIGFITPEREDYLRALKDRIASEWATKKSEDLASERKEESKLFQFE